MPTRPLATGSSRGRPRAGGEPAGHDARREILDAARRLFSDHGYEQVSVSRIAREVGLKQSSVYYYFRGKDGILAELVADSHLVPNDALRDIVAAGGSAAVQLHRFVRADVVNLCLHPVDLGGLQRAAARERSTFDEYWEQVADIERQLGDVIRRGIDERELRPVDPELTAVTILTNDEGAQSRFHGGARWPAAVVADGLADLVVAGLLCDPARLDAVRREARDLDGRSG